MLSDHETTRRILDSIRQLVRELRTSSRSYEMKWKLSSAQLFVLHALEGNVKLSLNELAEKTFTHQSSVSVVVNRLVAQGLVKRTKASDDKRRLNLSLTGKGNIFLKKLPQTTQEKIIIAIKKLPEKKRMKLCEGLEEVVAHLGLGGSSPPLFFEEAYAKNKEVK